MRLPVVKIKAANARGYKLINERDFDPKKHERFDAPKAAPKAKAGDDLPALRAAYEEQFGKRPYMGWDADKLRAKLAEAE